MNAPCGHGLGARYQRGGVTDLRLCECGEGCSGWRTDDGGGPEAMKCCKCKRPPAGSAPVVEVPC